jgi:hypothetical protein
MRLALLVALASLLLAGCADRIPQKTGFGTTSLKPLGNIPPEFAAFNNYDPGVNAVLADQICAQPDVLLEQKNLPAQPGELIARRWRCQPYRVTFGNLSSIYDP